MKDVTENTTRTRTTAGRRGQNVVLLIYALVVAIAGLTGYLLGTIGPKALRPVKLFFLIEVQPTPLGLALYGMVTLGVGLGILLVAVRYASRRYEA